MTYHESLIKVVEKTKNCMHGINFSLISKTLWLGFFFRLENNYADKLLQCLPQTACVM